MIDVIAPLQVGSTRCHDQIFDVGADIPERGLEKMTWEELQAGQNP